MSALEKSENIAAAVPAASPETAQTGITLVTSHISSVTEMHRPRTEQIIHFLPREHGKRQFIRRAALAPIAEFTHRIGKMFMHLRNVHDISAVQSAGHTHLGIVGKQTGI